MKKILIIVLFFLVQTSAFSQNWNAVCAGINDYPGSGNDLDWCVNDVTVMRQYLINHKQWSSDKIALLTNGNAEESEIEDAMRSMSTSAGNTNLFHYAGHGDSQELEGSDGLIPPDSWDARITQSELQSNFGSTYNQCAAFLDACGTGIFPRDMTKGVISSACGASETAGESSSIQHGYYTYYLLQGLTQSSINTAEQLHSYAAPLVTQAKSTQHPQLGDNFDGYLSIYNASYTLSGTLQRYETWSGSVALQGNVTVPSGLTLTIASNATINFNGFGIILNGGSVNYQSGFVGVYLKQSGVLKGYFGTIQAAVNYASSGQMVELQARTYNESPSFSSKSNITLNGLGSGSTILNGNISVTNSDNIDISNMSVNGTISINDSYYTLVYNSLLSAATVLNDYGGTGTSLSNSTATYSTTSFAFNSYGGTGNVYYTTISNHDCAVYLTNGASYNVGDQNLFCNNLLDIYAPSPAYAYAISNDYSAALPQTISGNVFVTGVNGVCGMAKSSIAANIDESDFVNSKLLKDADEKYLALLRKIDKDKKEDKYDKNKYVTDFSDLIGDYKNVINIEKEKYTVKAALSKLNHLYKANEDKNSFLDYLKQLSNDKENEEFIPYINRHFIWNYVDKKDYENSLSLIDEIIATANYDEDLICEMLYEKGLIYKYYLDNKNKAGEIFTGLITKYSQNLLAQYASVETGVELETPKNYNTLNSEETGDFSADNYPNPFNPTTTISYTLPVEGRVQIKVFDILGREVETLVDNVIAAGKHKVEWNGSNWASGIYFYSVTFKNQILYKKMLMIK